MSKKSTASLYLLFLATGVAIGWMLGLFSPDKTRKSHQKFLKRQADTLNNYLKDTELKQRISDIFNKYSEESADIYNTAQKALFAKLTTAKESLEDIDKKKYTKIVSNVVDEIKSTTSISGKNLEKLKSYFISDLNRIKKHYSQNNSQQNES